MTKTLATSAHEKWVEAMKRISVLEQQLREMEAALREIAEHVHCDPRDCGVGTETVTDYGHAYGHRCAAEIARKALERS